MPPPLLLTGVQDNILVLSLNRPEKLNAINNDLARALRDALARADANPEVRAVLLRGKGRAFCAGRDVSQAPTDDDLEWTQQVSSAIVHCSKPVVAAVQGWAVTDDDGLETQALCVARRLASLAPAVAARFKRVLNAVGLAGFDHAINLESAMQRELMQRSRDDDGLTG